ncbi:hypothetical protein NDU88_008159 [Pleurodeles waltl]|uniref:Uncharacterized protein n=1 Tax=Pleurodeles waltl TaxID=8319 RepID=A0AAV7N450_PLEWA|nr:hypothetical protein NDU88_008159 [Pleurodeles waltl]
MGRGCHGNAMQYVAPSHPMAGTRGVAGSAFITDQRKKTCLPRPDPPRVEFCSEVIRNGSDYSPRRRGARALRTVVPKAAPGYTRYCRKMHSEPGLTAEASMSEYPSSSHITWLLTAQCI